MLLGNDKQQSLINPTCKGTPAASEVLNLPPVAERSVVAGVFIITILLLLCGASDAAEIGSKWSAQDTALQATFTALALADWNQTLHISRNPSRYKESNAILGIRPGYGRVNSYFTACILGHAAISSILDTKYRTLWQSFWIGCESAAVGHNYEAGIRISF